MFVFNSDMVEMAFGQDMYPYILSDNISAFLQVQTGLGRF